MNLQLSATCFGFESHLKVELRTVYEYIQSVSRLVDITAGSDFLGLCDQKS